MFGGLSVVIAFWGEGGLCASWPLAPPWRRLLTGALFGSVGAATAYSPLGRVSGAHINPAVTLAFWLARKLRWRDTLGYVLAQLAGGVAGAAALRLWGAASAGMRYGASLPQAGITILWPLLGEVLCGFLLVLLIFVMGAHDSTKRWTPLINPPLFALLTWLESPLSGASANPARSFGPEVVAGLWQGQWIYFAGPCLGAAIATAVLHQGVFGRHVPHEARVAHPPQAA